MSDPEGRTPCDGAPHARLHQRRPRFQLPSRVEIGQRPLIASFRSRALKRLWERNDARRLPPQDVPRIRRILRLLDQATAPEDLDLPTYHFHPLTGDLRGRYAVTVRANWRITFAWDGGDAVEVDYEDYH